MKDDINVGVNGMLQKDLEIAELINKVNFNDSIMVKHKYDFIERISEKKKNLNIKIIRLISYINELDNVREDLLLKNKIFEENWIKNLNSELIFELEQEKRIKFEYENEILKLKQNNRGSLDSTLNGTLEFVPSNEIQRNLISYQRQIADLQIQNEKLRQNNKKIKNLESDIEILLQKNEKLKNKLTQVKEESSSYKINSDNYAFQLADYRERIELTTETANKQLKEMNNEILFYQKEISNFIEEKCKLEQNNENLLKEINDLKEKLNDNDSKILGLPEAVAQIRQLKTFVSVRDTYIADLIKDLDIYKLVIEGFENQFSQNFNFNAFYTQIIENQNSNNYEKKMEKASKILDNYLGNLKNPKVGDVQIIINGKKVPSSNKLEKKKNLKTFLDQPINNFNLIENKLQTIYKDYGISVNILPEIDIYENINKNDDEWIRNLQIEYNKLKNERNKILIELNELKSLSKYKKDLIIEKNEF